MSFFSLNLPLSIMPKATLAAVTRPARGPPGESRTYIWITMAGVMLDTIL